MGRTARLWVMAAAALALAGCKDLGVRGSANTPYAIARMRPPQYWAYQAVNPASPKPYEGRTGSMFSLGGQSFIVQFPDYAGPRTLLRPAGAAAGATVYALAWDQPPFEQLYVSPDPTRVQVAGEIWK